jgi:hypothetical protein
MYYLSSSLADRIRFDQAARAYAWECIRAAEMPIWEIDPVALAHHVIELEGLPDSDDPEEAEARYIDAFLRERAEMLQDEIDEAIDALPYDIGDIADYIRPIQLLWMPSSDSLEALGAAAGWFRDDGRNPDGDLLLEAVDAFSEDEIAAALAAGGKVIEGYTFYYPRAVSINPQLQCIITTGEVAIGKWCGYNCGDKDVGMGYALQREVAIAVCAASFAARAKEEDNQRQFGFARGQENLC